METQKTLNSQTILSKESNAGGITILDFNHSNKNGTVLAQKQTHRPMLYNRDPQNKPTQLQPSDI
jgi:hypothetical protein